jgi:UDP-2,3-diacylglucosamine hydrolase
VQWLLADAHGGAHVDADAGLVALLEMACEQSVDLYILGDLFAVWLAPERFLTPFQQKIMTLLRAIKAREKEVVFVVGNRDYLVSEAQLGRTFSRVIEDEALEQIGQQSSLLLHGDRINPDDRLYQFWFRLSRNRVSRRALQNMPASMAQSLSQGLEAKLAQTNKAYKSGKLPVEHLHALSRRAKTLGAARVILGHFHADTTIQAEDGVPVVIAPAWLDQRKILIAKDDGELLSINPLES